MNKQEWEFKHAACPRCGATNCKTSNIGVPEISGNFEDKINTAECTECPWKGTVNELVPANSGQEKPMPIRMLDFQGETYACTKDIVVTMLDFNRKLNNTLATEDQRKFTDAIFGEITKMMITVDKQHWVNKYDYEADLAKKEKEAAKEKLEGMAGTDEKKG